jgi:hypothetical protein
MRAIRRSSHLRRYRHLPFDVVLALLYSGKEAELVAGHSRRGKEIR